MNTLIRIQGYVLSADIHEPTATIQDEKPKYELQIAPFNPNSWHYISEIAEELKWKYEQQQYQKPPHYAEMPTPKVKDRLEKDGCILFESLYKPKLIGTLAETRYDDELFHQYVQVVGHVQIQELGNCFLSFHIVEPQMHPSEGFDK